MGGAQHDAGIELLRLGEIGMGGLGQRVARQIHDALIPLHLFALRVDGEGEVTLAQQQGHQGAVAARPDFQAFQPFGVETGITTQMPRRAAIGHQGRDRAVALGLQREDAIEFQGRGHGGGQRHRLGQQMRHRLGIGMPAQDAVDRRAQPHQAAAHVALLDLERQRQVVVKGKRTHAANIMRLRRRNTRRGSPSGHAGGFPPRRTPPIAARRSPRTSLPRRDGRAGNA